MQAAVMQLRTVSQVSQFKSQYWEMVLVQQNMSRWMFLWCECAGYYVILNAEMVIVKIF